MNDEGINAPPGRAEYQDETPASRAARAEAEYTWRLQATVNRLHQELASYYRVKSKDIKTIRLIWQQIELKESELYTRGINVF